jgi:hypothetical protein
MLAEEASPMFRLKLAACGFLILASANAYNSSAPQGLDATVRGRVVEASGGPPVSGAEVHLGPCYRYGILLRAPDASSVTDAAGAFVLTLKAPPPGSYCVHASRAPLLDRMTEITIDPIRPSQNVQVELRRAAVIFGKVLDEEGKPRSKIEVNAVRCCHGIDGGTMDYLEEVAKASTDDRGEYRLHGLEPGAYLLWARRDPDCNDCLNTRPNWAPTFYPGVVETSHAVKINALSGNEARADFALVSQRNYQFRFEVALPRDWSPETQAASEINIFVSPRQRDVTVTAWWALYLRTAGDRTGVYTSPWLPPGVYHVAVTAVPKRTDGKPPDDYCYAEVYGQLSVELVDRDVDAGKLLLQPGVTLRGHVIEKNGQRLRVTGESQHRATVSLRAIDVGFEPPCYWSLKEDGTFVMTNIPKGRYWIELRQEQDFNLSAVRYGGRDVLDSGFRLDGEPEGPFELVLDGLRGSIDGVVRNAIGEPVPRAHIALIPPSERRANEKEFHNTNADDTGAFRFEKLRSGVYTVIAWAGDGPDQTYLRLIFARNYLEPDFPAMLASSGVQVRVEAGAIRTVTLRAIPKSR